MIAEAGVVFSGIASYDIRNDVIALLPTRDLQDRFGLQVDMTLARECIPRLRTAARTGIYPRYLLSPRKVE